MATAGQLTWAQLVAIARRVGVKVVEAPSTHRGKLGKMGSILGLTIHHTGTANTYKPEVDYPDFNVVKEGRAGLENSLSAYGIGRFDAIYVFSEYLSWHAGEWLWNGVTDGNGHFLGIECAGVSDFTEFQRKVYPRLVAAILLEIGQPANWAPRHAEGAMPRGRKTDAANLEGNFYQGKSFRQWVDFFMANPAFININYAPQEDDLDAAQDKMLRDIHFELTNRFPSRVAGSKVTETAVGMVLNTDAATFRTEAKVNTMVSTIDALTKLVALQNGLTVDDVRKVVSEEIAKGLDVDVNVATRSV